MLQYCVHSYGNYTTGAGFEAEFAQETPLKSKSGVKIRNGNIRYSLGKLFILFDPNRLPFRRKFSEKNYKIFKSKHCCMNCA